MMAKSWRTLLEPLDDDGERQQALVTSEMALTRVEMTRQRLENTRLRLAESTMRIRRLDEMIRHG